MKFNNSVMGKQGADMFFGHISFPDANNSIAAFVEIGVLCSVAFPLGFLALGEWIKARMTMPVFAINLYDELSDSKVNNEFRFYQSIGFKSYAKSFKNFFCSYLKFIGVRLLTFLFAFQKCLLPLFGLFGMGLPELQHFRFRLGIVHWIVGNHTRGIGLIGNSFLGFFGQFQSESAGRRMDVSYSLIENLGNTLRSLYGIMSFEIVKFFIRPFCGTRTSMFSAKLGWPPIRAMTTPWTNLDSQWSSRPSLVQCNVSTIHRAKHLSLSGYDTVPALLALPLFLGSG